jgi:hypothetical protein
MVAPVARQDFSIVDSITTTCYCSCSDMGSYPNISTLSIR